MGRGQKRAHTYGTKAQTYGSLGGDSCDCTLQGQEAGNAAWSRAGAVETRAREAPSALLPRRVHPNGTRQARTCPGLQLSSRGPLALHADPSTLGLMRIVHRASTLLGSCHLCPACASRNARNPLQPSFIAFRLTSRGCLQCSFTLAMGSTQARPNLVREISSIDCNGDISDVLVYFSLTLCKPHAPRCHAKDEPSVHG